MTPIELGVVNMATKSLTPWYKRPVPTWLALLMFAGLAALLVATNG